MAGVYFVDCGNPRANLRLKELQSRGIEAERIKISGDYLDLLKHLAQVSVYNHAWILSSLCDYRDFDFNWRPRSYRQNLLHVFPSNNQVSGDTFFVDFGFLRTRIDGVESLDWYEQICYCRDQSVPRRVTVRLADNPVNKDSYFLDPIICFDELETLPNHTPKLWSFNKKIENLPGPSTESSPLDIIHVSNGEIDADRWYTNLSNRSKNYLNRLIRVTGINDRTQALREAAKQSQTPWFFAVPAKIEIQPGFDWYWHPPMLQRPCHYIFYSRNPVNGLEYGHMGMVAYHRELALATKNPGLDFTMSQPIRVIPKVIGTAHYNATPVMAWRTAFREVIKLRHDYDQSGNIETAYRLRKWSTGTGHNAIWSIRGSQDANDYYDLVRGDLDRLVLSYQWDWVNDRFSSKYAAD